MKNILLALLVTLALCSCTPQKNTSVGEMKDVSVSAVGVTTNKQTQTIQPQVQTQTSPTTMTGGMYSEYSKNLIGMHEKTVLFFHAPWCPSCKAADIGIKKGDIPKNLAILKVDYDSSDELKQKYGVTYQHTFVQVDAEGNMIKKWAGGNTLQDILDEVK